MTDRMNQFDSKLGMTPAQWTDLIRRLNDPNDPAGNYRPFGGPGDVMDVNKMDWIKGA